MDTYGLLGFPLGHSFSKAYFEKKFEEEKRNARFLNFELPSLENYEDVFLKNPDLRGFSVTIPYKEQIIPYLSEIDGAAREIQAVNSVKVIKKRGKAYTTGYNTDYYGFGKSLDNFLPEKDYKALILGTGGASKAVAYALKMRNIPYKFVSRSPKDNQYTYEDLDESLLFDYQLIINTTPLGTFPKVTEFPNIPYQFLTSEHYLYDLVYNPEQTAFLSKGKQQGAKVCNGYEMLIWQAKRSWEIWNAEF